MITWPTAVIIGSLRNFYLGKEVQRAVKRSIKTARKVRVNFQSCCTPISPHWKLCAVKGPRPKWRPLGDMRHVPVNNGHKSFQINAKQ